MAIRYYSENCLASIPLKRVLNLHLVFCQSIYQLIHLPLTGGQFSSSLFLEPLFIYRFYIYPILNLKIYYI